MQHGAYHQDLSIVKEDKLQWCIWVVMQDMLPRYLQFYLQFVSQLCEEVHLSAQS